MRKTIIFFENQSFPFKEGRNKKEILSLMSPFSGLKLDYTSRRNVVMAVAFITQIISSYSH